MAIVRILVEDVDRAIAFYVGQLGFVQQEKWGSAFAQIERDGLQVWLSGPETSAAKPMPDGAKPVPGGWNRIVLRVDDLPGRIEALRQEGVRFRNDLITGPGGSQILVEDGEGNVVELFEPRA